MNLSLLYSSTLPLSYRSLFGRSMASLKGLKKKHDKKKMPEVATGGKVSELNPPPEFIAERLALWDRLKAEQDAHIASQPHSPIEVTLPDGKIINGESWKTTPFDIAMGISKGLADNCVIARVDGQVFDLDRVLEKSCRLELIKFDDEEGKAVFWHSSAHILGEAMERVYGGHLCYGPPIENGFYYDMSSDHKVSDSDFKVLDNMTKSIVKEKQPFERLEMKKEDLLEMFKFNKFKLRILNERVKTPTTTVYRCGPLIDLCRGPHVRHTGKIKSMAITKNSATYWEGNSEAESLQRIYGISFPDNKLMKEWKLFQEEAAKRDHRKLGREQDLFFFHELSPGSCFFQPKGAHIYNKLIDFIKEEYWERGFKEVISPNIYNANLWKTSGHWDHYAENMFRFEIEKEKFGLKPMNCPGHCLIFDHGVRSWRDLPIRMSDFGVLHRNELSGALTGLLRVRRFQQDDAHIFCMPNQIKDEMKGALDFLKAVYHTFGFSYNLALSTRPEKFMGDPSVWDQAEKDLTESLNATGLPWKLNPGDGAFYGPKIDVNLTDALRRQHQCGTIQLDFQLPLRFNLNYIDDKGEKKHPVIIHRAILGSVERMFAILTESFGGKWPFWLSPRQAMVVPVGPQFNEYALNIKKKMTEEGFCCEADVDDGSTMNKKVRNAQLAQFNFIFVVGEKERENQTVNIRTRDNKVHGERSIDDVIAKFKVLSKDRVLNSEEFALDSKSS
ncbi:threonine--tRNA ligase 1, cytoplasmic isoform X3 [Lepeophtheirus salmonis]|uniref:threonine--tRNA ligase 1, cytoplasmic isoform X3 n=1 Tax=Lepeophtheirus salmonis TaxID=72036 RepID=UPI001AE5A734|nr:threonine--tRNA ligase 1, cytoplasmic-like isoform X2 [Lepeophtheirus salmonis]